VFLPAETVSYSSFLGTWRAREALRSWLSTPLSGNMLSSTPFNVSTALLALPTLPVVVKGRGTFLRFPAAMRGGIIGTTRWLVPSARSSLPA